MKKKFGYKESIGLPGGPNEMFTYVTGVFSTEGYKANSPDVNNPFNIIPSGNITMEGVNFPVKGTDNLGNTKVMMPGNNYKFPGDIVFETPMAQNGKENTLDYAGNTIYGVNNIEDYRTAYNEGRVLNYNKDGQLEKTLDPVIISADKQTGKNILEDYPYYNQLTKEEKKYFRNRGPIGRQIRSKATNGVGVTADGVKDFAMAWLRDLPLASLQAPQSALVEGVEGLRGNEFNMLNAITPGQQRVPSDVWGFETTDDMSWYNPRVIGNFVMDMVADPMNVVGAGVADDLLKLGLKQRLRQAGRYATTQTPLRNAYKYVPGTVKEAPFVPMYRTQKPGQTQEILEVLDLQKKANEVGYENLSITEKVKLSQFQSRPNIGQGFDIDLSKANYYGHPNIRRTRGYDETPEVLRAIVSREQAELFNVKNFPQYAKQSTAHRTEHILPMDMIQQAEKFSFDDLARLREEESLLNPKPHWLKGYPKQLPGSPNAVSSLDDVSRVVADTPQPWQMQEFPGLHLKSTMTEGPISKIVEPKTGLINTEQALAIIGKESGGADKVALIRQGLGDNIPKKMDYNEFRKLVQDQLIPLERQFVDHKSNYGINRLGYKEPEFITRTVDGKIINEMTSDVIENQTLILGNKSKFGRGSSAHGNPEETLGHAHFLRDAESPDVLTVTQIQSDAFQGTHRINYKQELANAQHNAKFYKEQADELIKAGENADIYLQESKIAQSKVDELTSLNQTQKKLLDKNHQERYLQELVDYAASRGDINKVRVPTSETAAKVQGYNKVTTERPQGFEGYWDVNTSGKYSSEHQTILKKYSQQPKTIKKLFGKEPTIVTDSKGNTWYEFDIPEKFKQGKGEIKAYQRGGSLPKAQDAGEIKDVSEQYPITPRTSIDAQGLGHLLNYNERPSVGKIRNFQKIVGIEPTGLFGNKTAEAYLGKKLNEPKGGNTGDLQVAKALQSAYIEDIRKRGAKLKEGDPFGPSQEAINALTKSISKEEADKAAFCISGVCDFIGEDFSEGASSREGVIFSNTDFELNATKNGWSPPYKDSSVSPGIGDIVQINKGYNKEPSHAYVVIDDGGDFYTLAHNGGGNRAKIKQVSKEDFAKDIDNGEYQFYKKYIFEDAEGNTYNIADLSRPEDESSRYLEAKAKFQEDDDKHSIYSTDVKHYDYEEALGNVLNNNDSKENKYTKQVDPFMQGVQHAIQVGAHNLTVDSEALKNIEEIAFGIMLQESGVGSDTKRYRGKDAAPGLAKLYRKNKTGESTKSALSAGLSQIDPKWLSPEVREQYFPDYAENTDKNNKKIQKELFKNPNKAGKVTGSMLLERYNILSQNPNLYGSNPENFYYALASSWQNPHNDAKENKAGQNKIATMSDYYANSVFNNLENASKLNTLEEQPEINKAGFKLPWKQNGGKLTVYKDYVNGLYEGTPKEDWAKQTYDKLNRIYYKSAKDARMSVPNYIMSKLVVL